MPPSSPLAAYYNIYNGGFEHGLVSVLFLWMDWIDRVEIFAMEITDSEKERAQPRLSKSDPLMVVSLPRSIL